VIGFFSGLAIGHPGAGASAGGAIGQLIFGDDGAAAIDAQIAQSQSAFDAMMADYRAQFDKLVQATGEGGLLGSAINGVGGGTGKIPQMADMAAIAKATQEAKKFATSIVGYANSINSAFNSMISGLLTGTETFQDAFRKMAQSLVMDFISAIERMAERWLISELFMTSTTATQRAVRDALQVESSKGDIAGLIERALTAVTASGQQTFAGATAWFSPTLGPAAPAAGAAVAAGNGGVRVCGHACLRHRLLVCP
jgi:hypothetical protein